MVYPVRSWQSSFFLGGIVTTNVKKSAEVEVAFSRVGYGEGPNNL